MASLASIQSSDEIKPLQNRKKGRLVQAVIDQHKFFGAAVAISPLKNDPKYREILKTEFNAATAENCMKWGSLQKSKNEWDFVDADYFVDFCRENDIVVKGHTLVWHNQLPTFVSELSLGTNSGKTLLQYMEEHIRTTMHHFKGRVRSWDVLNEIISDDGLGLRDCIFTKHLGSENWGFVAKVYRWAHEVDPECLLFYNDYSISHINSKSNYAYQMIKYLLNEKVPVHGVGFQGHIHASHYNANSVYQNIKRFTDLGILVNFSEVDVRTRGISNSKSIRLKRQEVVYEELSQCLVNHQNFESFTLWGFTDLHSWVHGFFGEDEPLLWDKKYNKKPAYEGFLRGLKKPSSYYEENQKRVVQLNRHNIHSARHCVVSDAIYYVKKEGMVSFTLTDPSDAMKPITKINIKVATQLRGKYIELYGYENCGTKKLQLLSKMQLQDTGSYDIYEVQQFVTEKEFKIASNCHVHNGKEFSVFTLLFRHDDVGNFREIQFL